MGRVDPPVRSGRVMSFEILYFAQFYFILLLIAYIQFSVFFIDM